MTNTMTSRAHDEIVSYPLDDALRQLVDSLIASFDETTGNWKPAWSGAGTLPYNATTGANYHGINTIMLWNAQLLRQFSRPAWATYNQWRGVGGQVQRGARSVRGIKVVTVGRDPEVEDSGFSTVKAFPLFNIDQVDGAPEMPGLEFDVDWWDPFDQMVMTLAPKQIVGRPCYVPELDTVSCPDPGTFNTIEQYAHTLCHELGHWTGHQSRLNREQKGRADVEAYAFEELVAEISSAITTATLHIPGDAGRTDHIVYVKGWLSMLDSDPKVLMTAASLAQKASDYLIDHGCPSSGSS